MLGALSLGSSGCGSDAIDGEKSATGGQSGEGGTGGDATGGTADASIPEADFAARYAAAVCDNVGACCTRAGYEAPPAGCLAPIANELAEQYAKYRTNLTYDPKVAANCVAQLTAGVKACDNQAVDKASACRLVYEGKLVLATSCRASVECDRPSTGSVACVNGTCTLLSDPTGLGKEGEECVFRPCEQGLFCDPNTGQCSAGLVEGDFCSNTSSLPCAAGLFCDPVTSSCTAGITEGSCLGNSGQCDARSHFCDDCTQSCEAKLRDGAACRSASDCASGACYPSGCSKPLFGLGDPFQQAGFCGAPGEWKADTRMCPTDSEPSDDFAWDTLVGIGAVSKVWGSGPGDVYAITRNRELFHYGADAVWTRLIVSGIDFYWDVWGPNETETYLVTNGGVLRGTFPGPWAVIDPAGTVMAVTGSADGTTYIAGGLADAFILASKSDGTWSDLGYRGAYGIPRSLWVSPSGDIYAITNSSLIRNRGAGWEFVLEASSVSGAGSDWYATGPEGLLHFDAKDTATRIQFLLRTGVVPNSVWAYDEQTVFVTVSSPINLTGLPGALFVGDGNANWTKLGRFANPNAVWGPSADELYVGTEQGIVHGVRR